MARLAARDCRQQGQKQLDEISLYGCPVTLITLSVPSQTCKDAVEVLKVMFAAAKAAQLSLYTENGVHGAQPFQRLSVMFTLTFSTDSLLVVLNLTHPQRHRPP